jgi:hypothetical protein
MPVENSVEIVEYPAYSPKLWNSYVNKGCGKTRTRALRR